MDRYPSPLEPTRDRGGRRLAQWVFATTFSAVLGLELGGGSLTIFWRSVLWIAIVGSLLFILWDEYRLMRLDAREWSTDQWNLLRENEYQRRRGIFLVSSLTLDPADSRDGRTWWKAEIQLVQHSRGPLSEHKIKEVEYCFGPNFEEVTIKRYNAESHFRYETRLYGSALVLGRAVFRNPFRRPQFVEQYLYIPRPASPPGDVS